MIRLKQLLALLAALTLILMSLGSYVRTTGAGLSCPDWPLCFGRVIPDFSVLGVPQEAIHRYLGALVGVLTIAFVFVARSLRGTYPKLFHSAVTLLILVAVQGMFGGLTVTLKLNPFIVAAHLTLATIFFQAIALLLLQTVLVGRSRPEISSSGSFRQLLLLTSFAVLLQIVIGGFVGASGASLVCKDFPLCGGKLLPDFHFGPHAVQASHRLLGYTVFVLTICLSLFAKREKAGVERRRGHLRGMVALVVIQALVGIGNIHMGIAPAMTIVHLILAQLLLLGLLSLYLEIDREAKVIT